MSKETGGPAFPFECIVERDEKGHMNGFEISSIGMTLRDYFAAKAMQGDISFDPLSPGVIDEQLEKYASHYYRIADAMLKARK